MFGHPTQVDSQVDHKSTVQYMREIDDFLRLVWTCEPTCESGWPPIASPYTSSGFVNLRLLGLTSTARVALCDTWFKLTHVAGQMWTVEGSHVSYEVPATAERQ